MITKAQWHILRHAGHPMRRMKTKAQGSAQAKQRQSPSAKTASFILLAISAILLISVGCENNKPPNLTLPNAGSSGAGSSGPDASGSGPGPSGPGSSGPGPSLPSSSLELVWLSQIAADSPVAFRVQNPNNEAVEARLMFEPALDEDVLIRIGRKPAIKIESPHIIRLTATEAEDIQLSSIPTDGKTYTIIAFTADTDGNFDETKKRELRITTQNTVPSTESVTLEELPDPGAPFAFRVINPNDEAVQARLTLQPELLSDERLTIGESELAKEADGSYVVSLAVEETTDIRLISALSTDGTPYTITAITTDPDGNFDESKSAKLDIATDYGDSVGTAQSITVDGGPIQGTLSSGDSDYFAVTLDSSDSNRFRVYSEGDTDTVGSLEVMGESEAESDDNSGTNNNFEIITEIDASTSTYYIKVSGKEADTSGSYSLSMILGNAPTFTATPTWADTTQTSATFSATANSGATLYWGVYADGSSAPDVSALITGTGAVASGTTEVTADTAASFTASELALTTSFDLYAVLKNDFDISSVASPVDFTTTLFSLHTNGVTVLCPNARVGASGVVKGKTYTKRTKEQITVDNAPTTCTTGIGSMKELFKDKKTFNGDISSWDTSNVIDMSYMFQRARDFNQPIGKWDVSNVRDMRHMFDGSCDLVFIRGRGKNCTPLSDGSLQSNDNYFNQDIGDWNVGRVENMSAMFKHAVHFNKGIGRWNVSKVRNMAAMFSFAKHFNQDIGTWKVREVESMWYMFWGAGHFNQDIGAWDTRNVTNMTRMLGFVSAAFNYNLTAWCVRNIPSEPPFFNHAINIPQHNKPKWGQNISYCSAP